MSLKNSNDTIGNRTRDLPVCSAVQIHILLSIFYSSFLIYIFTLKMSQFIAQSCNLGVTNPPNTRIQSQTYLILPTVKKAKCPLCATLTFSRLMTYIYIYIYIYIHTHTGCPRRNVPDFERMFLMLKYTDITQNTYVRS